MGGMFDSGTSMNQTEQVRVTVRLNLQSARTRRVLEKRSIWQITESWLITDWQKRAIGTTRTGMRSCQMHVGYPSLHDALANNNVHDSNRLQNHTPRNPFRHLKTTVVPSSSSSSCLATAASSSQQGIAAVKPSLPPPPPGSPPLSPWSVRRPIPPRSGICAGSAV